MNTRMMNFGNCLTLLIASAISLRAADAPKSTSPSDTNSPAAAKTEEAKSPAATIPDATHKPVLTTNTVTISGQRVTYVAETGMLPLLKPDGTSRASVFYIAYVKKGETNDSRRPVTYCFNGGPGSSSVWLHLGALGPRRVKMNEDGTLPKPLSNIVLEILSNTILEIIKFATQGLTQLRCKQQNAGITTSMRNNQIS